MKKIKENASLYTSDFAPESPLETALLFLVFNRPSTTQLVFNIIRKVKPKHLYIASDGPRSNVPGEKDKIQQVRQLVSEINWECRVKTLFRKENLGCGKAVCSAIDWFFEQEEEGIILEDDCLPSLSFFWYCEELLERFRHDERIMVISGNNFQNGRMRQPYSYYFSRFNHCWGWATWRRAWKLNDFHMTHWDEIKTNNYLYDILGKRRLSLFWTRIFNRVFSGDIDSWAYPWLLSCWAQNGLTILPNINLVSNIGFGVNATHTTNKNDPCSCLPRKNIRFPLLHPKIVIRDNKADSLTEKRMCSVNLKSIWKKIHSRFFLRNK